MKSIALSLLLVFTTFTVVLSTYYLWQDADFQVNNTVRHSVGVNWLGDVNETMNGYMAEMVFIDNAQLAPDQFGEFDSDSGIWKPIDVSGLTFGTNGFYLDFEDSANLGNDANGGTDLTEVNLQQQINLLILVPIMEMFTTH